MDAVPGVTTENIEGTAQDWVNTCGVCHVGGGQMEYDRDMDPYGTNAANNGDNNVVFYKMIPGKDGFTIEAGPMNQAGNKAEVDCLLCHLDATASGDMMDGNGRALYRSWGCGTGFPGTTVGPSNDMNCDGVNDNPMYDAWGVPAAGPYTGGQKYDMFNRNFAVKNWRMDLAASMGAGAIWNPASPTGMTWLDAAGNPMASVTLTAAQVASSPKSANCAPCHARNDATVGLPRMMGMKTGYGNYLLAFPPGSMDDQDTGAANAKVWVDFGCKTGMGKRAHRIGMADPQGDDRFTGTGNAQIDMMDMMANYGANGVYSPINMAGQPVGSPIPNKMPDIDIHDRAGLSCASCHYMLGTVDADTDMNGDGTLDAVTIPAGEYHGLHYDADVVGGMDHLFAQGDSSPDTKSKNNLDSTVSCESCHTTRTHPKLTDNGGSIVSPTPTHPTLPAFHLDKIACATCHIPATYSAPGRLKYRDWTAGQYKGGFRNMLDWNFSMVEGAHAPMPMIRQWLTKFHETKIYPVLPSILPIWVESNPVAAAQGNDYFGTPYPTAAQTAPVKNRDVVKAAELVAAANPQFDIRMNGGNAVPFFDGFVLADSWEIDTKAEIDAMLNAFASTEANTQALKLYHTHFDITHGVVPKAWALGGSERSGCVSCHSSADPNNANYHPDSVAFFEGQVQPLNNAVQALKAMGLPTNMAIGQFDTVNNWFSFFANFDCTALCGAGAYGDYDNPATTPAVEGLFNPNTGAPISGTPCGPMSPMHGMVPGGAATIDHCVGMMGGIADAVFGIQGFAAMVGMHDGIAGLQGFTVRETSDGNLRGCDPFKGVPGQTACMTHPDGNLLYSRQEVRSHWKIDLQQSYMGGKKRVTWPLPGSYDAADYCQDQGRTTGNPFAPNVGPCVGPDGIQGNADDITGPDGNYHIATGIPQNAFLGYNPSVLASLMVDQTGTSSYFAGLSSNFSAKASTTAFNTATVNFDSSNSECPAAGAPCTKSWNFGDGTAAGTGNSPSHQYAAATGVCVGDSNPNDYVKSGSCTGGVVGSCNTDVDCLYPVTMTITDKFGYSDTSSLRVEAKVLAPAATGVPTVNVSANRVANTATVTVTAGTAVVDYVYIDWLDGTKDANGADIAVGNNRTYGPHTYGFERAYKVRVKVRTKDNVYHYLTGIADVR